MLSLILQLFLLSLSLSGKPHLRVSPAATSCNNNRSYSAAASDQDTQPTEKQKNGLFWFNQVKKKNQTFFKFTSNKLSRIFSAATEARKFETWASA